MISEFFSVVRSSFSLITSLSLLDMAKALWPILVFDVSHYVIPVVVLFFTTVFGRSRRSPETNEATRTSLQQLVSVVIPAHNEEEHIEETILSLYRQTYQNIEIILVDDGSTDRTADISSQYVSERLRILRAPERQGKAFAHNLGMLVSRGEIIVVCDGDTVFDRNAIANIVQPFADPRVGAVSGTIRLKNPKVSFATRLQDLEYLISIEVGRIILARLNILHIVSGAFGAFRREAVSQLGGWEVSPGEDSDLTKGLRKIGWKIAFEPRAIAYTDAPITFRQLLRQRYRWARSVTLLILRKHRDMLLPMQAGVNFRLSNAWGAGDIVLMNIVLGTGLLLMTCYLLLFVPDSLVPFFIMISTIYLLLNFLQLCIALYVCGRWQEMPRHLLVIPVFWLYLGIVLKLTILVAIFDELMFRSSYRDPYVPTKISRVKPRWGEDDPFACIEGLSIHEGTLQ